eukprot:3700-Heterococcus_DN1.PRE.1
MQVAALQSSSNLTRSEGTALWLNMHCRKRTFCLVCVAIAPSGTVAAAAVAAAVVNCPVLHGLQNEYETSLHKGSAHASPVQTLNQMGASSCQFLRLSRAMYDLLVKAVAAT